MLVGNAVVLVGEVYHPGYTVEWVSHYLGIKPVYFVPEETKFPKIDLGKRCSHKQ